MDHIRRINGSEIINCITDFSQREGRVRYRIRLHLQGGENLIFADYARYEQYRRAWNNLRRARTGALELMIRQVKG